MMLKNCIKHQPLRDFYGIVSIAVGRFSEKEKIISSKSVPEYLS